MGNFELKAKIFGKSMLPRNKRFSRISIMDLPVLIREDGAIVCIPKNREMTHIGITGMTGVGKGIAGNSLLGIENWYTKRRCLMFNDFQQETLEYSFPSDNPEFNDNLELINLKPLAYPMVYVYPNNVDLNLKEEELIMPHIKMSIPLQTVIYSVDKYFELKAAAKYITGSISKFMDCKDLVDIGDVIDEILDEKFEKKGEGYENMKFKIYTIFKNIFNEEITEQPDAPARLILHKKGKEEYNGYTIQTLLVAGLIPSIQTSEIAGKFWFSNYMAFILQTLYQGMYSDPMFKGTQLAIYVPEIDKMWDGAKKSAIKDKLCLIGTNGRRAGIGLRWDAQDYMQVPILIRANTKFLIVLRKNSAKEVAGIEKDFAVGKEIQSQILNLKTDPGKGIFEAVLLTTDKFTIYNPITGKATKSSAPQKGRLITPQAMHRAPKK